MLEDIHANTQIIMQVTIKYTMNILSKIKYNEQELSKKIYNEQEIG